MMNKQNIFLTILAVVVLVVAGYSLTRVDTAVAPAVGDQTTYSNSAIGLEFTYRTGPSGYVVSEAIPMAVDPSLVRFINLRSADAATPPTNGEGPAQISISVYKNTANEWSKQWAESHPLYSNIKLKQGDVSDTVVGGANAAQYLRDGLYQGEVVVVAHGGYVYVFDGAYSDPESQLRKDFAPLIDSVKFIPIAGGDSATPSAASGKLNIDAICQGALAYMTFASGAEADAFVADCKAGKHPEVIEKYKADNNLGDGRAI